MSLVDSTHSACTFRTLIDDGTLANAMSETLYLRIKDTVHGWRPSTRHLRMANGTIVPSLATWYGTVRFGNLQRFTSFEVFHSDGDWEFLFGKPLLCTFGAVHDYTDDTIHLQKSTGTLILPNLVHGDVEHTRAAERPSVEKHTNVTGDGKSPLRGVFPVIALQMECTTHNELPTSSLIVQATTTTRTKHIDYLCRSATTHRAKRHMHIKHCTKWPKKKGTRTLAKQRPHEHASHERATCITSTGDSCTSPAREVTEPKTSPDPSACVDPVYSLDPTIPEMPGKDPQDVFIDTDHADKANVFTCTTNPQNPARLAVLLDQIHVGPDLSPEEQLAVQQLITEFADCFALSMAEVILVDDAIHRLNIPANATFSCKVRQRPLTPPQ